MRKILFICVLLAYSVIISAKVHFGIDLGYNMGIEFGEGYSTPATSVNRGMDINNGFYVDGIVLWQLGGNKGLGVSTGVGYSYSIKNVVAKDNYWTDLRFNTLNIPAHISYEFNIGDKKSIFLFAGPDLRVALDYNYTDVVETVRKRVTNSDGDGYKIKTEHYGYRWNRIKSQWVNNEYWQGEDPNAPDGITDGKEYKRMDLGIDVGFGVTIRCFVIKAQYSISPLNSSKNDLYSIYHDNLRVGVGIML